MFTPYGRLCSARYVNSVLLAQKQQQEAKDRLSEVIAALPSWLERTPEQEGEIEAAQAAVDFLDDAKFQALADLLRNLPEEDRVMLTKVGIPDDRQNVITTLMDALDATEAERSRVEEFAEGIYDSLDSWNLSSLSEDQWVALLESYIDGDHVAELDQYDVAGQLAQESGDHASAAWAKGQQAKRRSS